MKKVPRIFVLDVDGVMTTGQFLYSKSGKVYKVFGPHDADGLKMLKGKLDILFVTADKRGFDITKKRIVDDMGYQLKLVTEEKREKYFSEEIGFDGTIFMADGIFDAPILKKCMCGIAPQNARPEAKAAAQYVTSSASGCGAVLDACIYILEVYFDHKQNRY
jgi:3-deoxy-D-manno-octulosonate 8-phosphate phosphatase (KDO 8-P phosphatase)